MPDPHRADLDRGVILVTGIQAAGKSTIGPLLAARFPRSAFIEGDLIWKLVVSGREDMTADPSPEALRQLQLRYRNGALLADSLSEAGFVAVHADIVMGKDIEAYSALARSRPLYIVVLRPDVSSVVQRQEGRGGNAYGDWTRGRTLEDAVAQFDSWIDATPRLGLWVDSSAQTPDETVDEIVRRLDEARVG